MVGVIPKILTDLVERLGGGAALAEVKARGQIPPARVYRLSEIYDDEEWARLLEKSAEVLNLSESELFRRYAVEFGQDALARWPKWFEMSQNSLEFLLRQPRIHNYFASGVQDAKARRAINDKFALERVDERTVVTRYRSPNRLCELYVQLAEWVIGHYGDRVAITHSRCLKRGDDACEIRLHWESFRGAP